MNWHEGFNKLSSQNITTYIEGGKMYLKLEGLSSFNKIPAMVTIPKIGLCDMTIDIEKEQLSNHVVISENGYIKLKIFPVINNGNSTWFTIKETPVDMTKEDIEKELGYKINIK